MDGARGVSKTTLPEKIFHVPPIFLAHPAGNKKSAA